MSGVLTEVDIIDVARIVEGEEETGNNFPTRTPSGPGKASKASAAAISPHGTSSFPTGRSASS